MLRTAAKKVAWVGGIRTSPSISWLCSLPPQLACFLRPILPPDANLPRSLHDPSPKGIVRLPR
jgi:hypothetical protein